MFIGTIPAEQGKIKPMSAVSAAGQMIINVLTHIYKGNILTKDAPAPLALPHLNGRRSSIVELTLGQAITNVQVIGSREKRFLEDALGPVVMKILNGLITKLALLKARYAKADNA